MQRFVWMVLHDGRSLVARCASATRERIERALSEPERFLEFSTPDGVDAIPTSAVRDFVVFDARNRYETGSLIERHLRL